VIYNDGKQRWRIDGKCNQCGQCWTGSPEAHISWTGKQVGTDGAFRDTRVGQILDTPVRPEIKQDCPACVLSGRYL
jgi:hypothetical protein